MVKNVMRPRFKGASVETFKGRSQTRTSGYVSLRDSVLALLGAGVKLQRARAEMYDTDKPEAVPADFDMRLRAPCMDIADASELHRAIAQREREIRERMAARHAERLKERRAAEAQASGDKVQVSPAAGKQGREAPANDATASI